MNTLNTTTTPITIDNIHVWDNFFPEDMFKELIHKSDFVPWKYCEVQSESDGNPIERFMTWNIYEEDIVAFDPMQIKDKVDSVCRQRILEKVPNADIVDMKRLRFNGTMKGEGYTMWPHADIFSEQTSVWTIVIYLKGDGGTTIYEHKDGPKLTTVDFKPNRAVMFPSRCWHKAESPEETYFRTSLGVVYMFDA
jgi:hypothetical protein